MKSINIVHCEKLTNMHALTYGIIILRIVPRLRLSVYEVVSLPKEFCLSPFTCSLTTATFCGPLAAVSVSDNRSVMAPRLTSHSGE